MVGCERFFLYKKNVFGEEGEDRGLLCVDVVYLVYK